TFPDGSTKITVVTDSNGQVTKYTGKDGKEYKLTEGLTPGDYKITVTKVPDGYKVTTGKTETVTVKTGEVAEHVALIATSETSKDETPSKEETKPGTPNKDTTKVDTGDHMNVIPIIVIMVISLIASIVVIIRKRKMRYEY
ncbi:MAG: LPXTG cell wall anchor domain-containing protein, partial [Eubacterium sp.]|nr:LPXTG cell wall anchor domain-containing protein [Eubacterium sp.]